MFPQESPLLLRAILNRFMQHRTSMCFSTAPRLSLPKVSLKGFSIPLIALIPPSLPLPVPRVISNAHSSPALLNFSVLSSQSAQKYLPGIWYLTKWKRYEMPLGAFCLCFLNFLKSILIGKVPWENVRPSIGVRDPVVVHFPEYSKEELVEILARTSPHTLPPFRGSIKKNGAVFRGFAALLYDTAYSSCRNLTEMQHLVTQIYPVFVKPLLDDPTRVLSLLELYSIAKPHFEKATQAIYARNISLTHEASVKGKSPSLLHLPHYSKFLLVASYLASYNPAKSDMEYFYQGAIPGQGTKRQRITHSTAKQAAKKSKIAPQLLGPQPFTLERMLAIFYSIVDDPNLTTTVHIDTQIATLASLQLLTPMGVKSGHAAKLAQLKYKAALPLDATKLIAQQLDFPLDKYLYSDDT
ncbi:hypothetical protein DSO57_1020010 [Entomophthora muscae]|uniref:Uncharacterized protein n=1 Tax=Entomophthora muscae TaxID=34485 RepID=A0ACC2TFC7_9FUNG|nr:hypothetical protein DSO57_1020010 [Entomophthora muscae]